MTTVPHFHTLTEMIKHHSVSRSDDVALDYRQRQLTYAQLWRESARAATTLLGEGIRKGDRVAFLGRNPDLYFVLLYGCALAGAIFVPLNSRLAPPEVAQVIDDSQPVLMFVDRQFEATLRACGAAHMPRLVPFAIDESTGDHDLCGWLANRCDVPVGDADPEDTVVVLYTSGTTGRAKGVQLSHRCFLAPRRAEMGYGDWMQWRESQEKLLAALPLFHIGCLSATMMAFYRGASVVLMDAAAPEAMLIAIAQKRITRVMLVPTLIDGMLASPRLADFDLSSLRLVMYGGSPIAPRSLAKALDVFRCEFAQGYGMTEVAGTCVFLQPQDHDPARPNYLLSIGKPGPTAELQVRDADGRPLRDKSVGEIWVRSAGLMNGYWLNPEEKARAVVDGWYRSGDAGYCDEDGYFYLTDRCKDMIVSGAENVYPAEIERELSGHPAVKESAVIGIPHDVWGESVHAVVVLHEGVSATAEELIAYLRTRIAGYKIPRSLEFSPVLPRNAFGKIVKYQLREPHWAGRTRRI